MITIRQCGVEMFEIDTALGCLLGFYMGTGIQANSGRVYKWCPFWGEMGTTMARVTSITRSNDYYSKSRIPVTFGSQINGHKGWDIANPKERMVRRMLKLLQQRAGSGPVPALLKMPVWEKQPRMFRKGHLGAQGESAQEAPVISVDKQRGTAREKQRCVMPIWWKKSDPVKIRKNRNNKIGRLLRWTLVTRGTLGESTQKYLLTRKREYLILEGDRAGTNAVMADQHDAAWELKEKKYWGVWAEAAEQVSAYWQAQEQSTMTHYLQGLREQGKIGLVNWGEQLHSVLETEWWLQWLEWETLWATKIFPSDVITWNIGPQGVDLSIPQIAQTLSKGSSIVMLQEVSFHPGERRRIKSILKKIGPEYWCCIETSQRVRAGIEEKKFGVSSKNYAPPWVYAVVTFLHKDIFKKPNRQGSLRGKKYG